MAAIKKPRTPANASTQLMQMIELMNEGSIEAVGKMLRTLDAGDRKRAFDYMLKMRGHAAKETRRASVASHEAKVQLFNLLAFFMFGQGARVIEKRSGAIPPVTTTDPISDAFMHRFIDFMFDEIERRADTEANG